MTPTFINVVMYVGVIGTIVIVANLYCWERGIRDRPESTRGRITWLTLILGMSMCVGIVAVWWVAATVVAIGHIRLS